MTSTTLWYCGKYTKYLSKDDLKLHHCLHRQKGKRKGKACRFLVKYPKGVEF